MDPKATKTLTLKAGELFELEFHETSKDSIFIEKAHKGPVMIYLAPLASNGVGNVWFKIFEKGLNSNGKFYTEELMTTGGKMKFAIPKDIKAGEYLMRTDILALHTAGSEGGAEFYPNCVQIRIEGGGKAQPRGYAIPGIYSPKDPGILINIYDKVKSYKIPGPPLYSKELGTTPRNQEGEIPEEDDKPEKGKPEDGKPEKGKPDDNDPVDDKPLVKTPKVPVGKKPCTGRKRRRHLK
ncbi:hypothetical protein GGI06_000326 [Coemansia sp. S85]|nr:hypothetical protein GGI06_000326 [Coemansia sp. S85]